MMTRSNVQPTCVDPVLKRRELFQCLSDGELPKRALSASIGLHGVLLMVLILVPVILPQTLHINYRTMMLAPPPRPEPEIRRDEVKREPIRAPRLKQPQPEPVVEKLTAPPKAEVLRQPERRLLEPVPKPAAPALAASVAPSAVNLKPLSVPAPPPPPVVTNVFSNVASPTIPVPAARNLETSGFGDTTNSTTRTSKTETVSAAGFGDAGGSREGGRSGRFGTAGVVGGFDTAGTGAARGGGNPGTVVAGGFATASSAPKSSPATSQKAPEPANEKPVEILVKPRPDYTDEARKMRIEGEVLLRVLFASTGTTRVLEVTRGLGYGLNENAIRAAEQIRFKPAQRAGQPVDSTAIVHIVFQLAY